MKNKHSKYDDVVHSALNFFQFLFVSQPAYKTFFEQQIMCSENCS